MTQTIKVAAIIDHLHALQQQGNYNEMLDMANLLLKKDPNNAEFILYKLQALEGMGKVTSDLKLLQHYVNMRSTDVTGFLLLYKFYVEQDDIANALIALAFALSIEPQEQECRRLMTNLLADVDSKYTSVKINVLTLGRIGHLACEIEPWAREYQQNEDSCLYLFLTNGEPAANPYLFELLKNVAHVIQTPFFHQLYLSRPLLLADEYYGKFPYDLHSSLRGASTIDINSEGFKNLIRIYQTTPPCLRIPEQDAEFAWQYLSQYQIQPTDKLVCLHVRDSAYLAQKYPNRDFSYHDFRDADIESYRDCVEDLIAKGYKVVRIGSNTDQQLSLDSPNYIDLCVNRDAKHGDFFEIFLLSVCRFYIANYSGPYGVAALFDTPTIAVNGVPFHQPYMKYGRFIPKLLFQHDELITVTELCQGRRLSEESDKPVMNVFNAKELAEHGYCYKENTAEDIKKAVAEFEQLVANNNLDAPLTKLQQGYFDAIPEDSCYKGSKNVISDSFLAKYPQAF